MPYRLVDAGAPFTAPASGVAPDSNFDSGRMRNARHTPAAIRTMLPTKGSSQLPTSERRERR
jgi:hypothetical protein